MKIWTCLPLLGAAAFGMAILSDSVSAMPVNGALGGIARQVEVPIELVAKKKSKRFVNDRAREAYINRRLSRMGVTEELDGTILLPGIGETWISGPPRSLDGSHQRLGVPLGGTGGRLGVPRSGPGGRLGAGGQKLH
jgi:hypothetical protein